MTSDDAESRTTKSSSRVRRRRKEETTSGYSTDEEDPLIPISAEKGGYTYAQSLAYRSHITPTRVITSPNMARHPLNGSRISAGADTSGVYRCEDCNSHALFPQWLNRLLQGQQDTQQTLYEGAFSDDEEERGEDLNRVPRARPNGIHPANRLVEPPVGAPSAAGNGGGRGGKAAGPSETERLAAAALFANRSSAVNVYGRSSTIFRRVLTILYTPLAGIEVMETLIRPCFRKLKWLFALFVLLLCFLAYNWDHQMSHCKEVAHVSGQECPEKIEWSSLSFWFPWLANNCTQRESTVTPGMPVDPGPSLHHQMNPCPNPCPEVDPGKLTAFMLSSPDFKDFFQSQHKEFMTALASVEMRETHHNEKVAEELKACWKKLEGVELKLKGLQESLGSLEGSVQRTERMVGTLQPGSNAVPVQDIEDLWDQVDSLKDAIHGLQAMQNEYARAIDAKNITAEIHASLGEIMAAAGESEAGPTEPRSFGAWIRHIIRSRFSGMSWENLQVQIEKSCESQLDEIRATVKEFEGKQASACPTCTQSVGAGQSQETLGIPVNISSYSEYFLSLIRKELAKFDADKTGMADHALESAGATVINTRCSETYDLGMAQLQIFGIPIWNYHNTPRKVIQPGMSPGQCWAFKGAHGYLVIKLPSHVRISGFTLEHIPVELSTTGNINSAPKDFFVLGLKHEKDYEGVMLGKYTYNDKGPTLQFFPAQTLVDDSFEIVELRITSNHGHPDYTCIYRFRIHGKRVN